MFLLVLPKASKINRSLKLFYLNTNDIKINKCRDVRNFSWFVVMSVRIKGENFNRKGNESSALMIQRRFSSGDKSETEGYKASLQNHSSDSLRVLVRELTSQQTSLSSFSARESLKHFLIPTSINKIKFRLVTGPVLL